MGSPTPTAGLDCLFFSACLGADPPPSRCAYGYAGELCSRSFSHNLASILTQSPCRCAPKFFRLASVDTSCHPCNNGFGRAEEAGLWVAIAAFVLLLCVGVASFTDRNLDLMVVSVWGTQQLAKAALHSAEGMKPPLDRLALVGSLVNFDVDVLRPACSFKGVYPFYAKLPGIIVIGLITGVIFLIMSAVYGWIVLPRHQTPEPGAGHHRRTSSRTIDPTSKSGRTTGFMGFKRRFVRSMVILLVLLYLRVTTACLELVNCQTDRVDGTSRLVTDPTIRCYRDSQHTGIVWLAWLLLFGYTLGLPLGSFFLIRSNACSQPLRKRVHTIDLVRRQRSKGLLDLKRAAKWGSKHPILQ